MLNVNDNGKSTAGLGKKKWCTSGTSTIDVMRRDGDADKVEMELDQGTI